jgi:hypothetical protein
MKLKCLIGVRNVKKKLTTKGDINNHLKKYNKDEKSDNSMRTDYVSELLCESNCEKCEDKECDKSRMKEVLKELQDSN